MRGSSIVQAISALKRAKDLLEDFGRQHPNGIAANLCKRCMNRCEAIFQDIITTPGLVDTTIQAVRLEWAADGFVVDRITQLAALVSPDQREQIEDMLEQLLKGISQTVELNKKG